MACASSETLLASILCPYFCLGSASIAQQLLHLILTLTSMSLSKELYFSHHGCLPEDSHWFQPRKEFMVDVDCTRAEDIMLVLSMYLMLSCLAIHFCYHLHMYPSMPQFISQFVPNSSSCVLQLLFILLVST